MTHHVNNSLLIALISMLLSSVSTSRAETLDASLLDVENRWARAAYEIDEQKRGRAFRKLLDDVRSLHDSYPGRPEAAAWHGVVARTCMEAKGSRGSMSLAKEARDALLMAESLDPLVFGGLVYANLGALYSKAPSGFGGFGNRTRGIGYLWKAIVIDPEDIESNYLYAEVLLDENDLVAAREALQRASDSPTRPGHLEADRIRKLKVSNLLAKVELRQ